MPYASWGLFFVRLTCMQGDYLLDNLTGGWDNSFVGAYNDFLPAPPKPQT